MLVKLLLWQSCGAKYCIEGDPFEETDVDNVVLTLVNLVRKIAIGTDDVYKTTEAIKLCGGKITREPGPLPGINTKITACLDLDGWKTLSRAGAGVLMLCRAFDTVRHHLLEMSCRGGRDAVVTGPPRRIPRVDGSRGRGAGGRGSSLDRAGGRGPRMTSTDGPTFREQGGVCLRSESVYGMTASPQVDPRRSTSRIPLLGNGPRFEDAGTSSSALGFSTSHSQSEFAGVRWSTGGEGSSGFSLAIHGDAGTTARTGAAGAGGSTIEAMASSAWKSMTSAQRDPFDIPED